MRPFESYLGFHSLLLAIALYSTGGAAETLNLTSGECGPRTDKSNVDVYGDYQCPSSCWANFAISVSDVSGDGSPQCTNGHPSGSGNMQCEIFTQGFDEVYATVTLTCSPRNAFPDAACGDPVEQVIKVACPVPSPLPEPTPSVPLPPLPTPTPSPDGVRGGLLDGVQADAGSPEPTPVASENPASPEPTPIASDGGFALPDLPTPTPSPDDASDGWLDYFKTFIMWFE